LLSFGQKKLIAVTQYSQSETGTNVYLDSNHHYYNTLQGALNSLQPKFKFDGSIYNFVLDVPVVSSYSDKYFHSDSYPLILAYTSINTLNGNNQVITSTQTGILRTTYTYTLNGLLASKTIREFNSGTWNKYDSTLYSYDQNGNKLTTAHYNFSSGFSLSTTDSSTFQPGTSNLVKNVSYYYNAGQNVMIPSAKKEITYNGNNIQYIDQYFGDGVGNLIWSYRFTYTYTGNKPTEYTVNKIFNNVLSTTYFAKGYFQYNAQNLPSKYLRIEATDTTEIVNYLFDSDNFVIESSTYKADNNNVLYLSNSSKFYYPGTLSIDDTPTDFLVTV
jgi:YD repeat-containing protein